jgi:Fe-S cluster assembly protein SufD
VRAEIVFVNGRYVSALSNVGPLPRGARIESLASALTAHTGEVEPYLARLAPVERHAFTALNTAFLAEGAFIRIPLHTILEEPIHVLWVSTDEADGRSTMSHPRVLTVIDDNSQASIVETYAGQNGGRYFTNVVTEIVLGENTVLDHYTLQHESVQGYHVGAMHVRAQRNANFTSHSIDLGGSLVRNDIVAVLDGEGVECTLNGLYLGNDQRLVDNHTTIDHAKPHCGSREMYKGILADRARGVFNGKIIVRPDAQKTDAKQTNRALLLSEDAQINTKPQLEIFANDVKCTHGAAVGQLDDEALFYLRSRGLGDAEARHLLVRAFAADVLSHMRLEQVRTGVEEVLLRQLSHALPVA